MIKETEKIIMEYFAEIKPKFPSYAAVYSSFIDYLKEKRANYDGTFHDFFENDFSKNDIIQSCVGYVRNSSKAKSVIAIERYLNAMSKLYEECIQKHDCNNRNLFAILPFGNLKSQVNEKLRDLNLEEKTSIPPIDETTAEKIVDYLEKEKDNQSIVFKRNSIILRLIILYGFKLEKLKYIKVSDLRYENHILDINNDKDEGNILSLELPYPLVRDISEYIEILKRDTNFKANQYLFLSSTGKSIDSSCCKETFDKINRDNSCCRITLVGICKYAIINMIGVGISTEKIKLISGVRNDIINDCERLYLKNLRGSEENNSLSREVNQKIRSIPIYDKVWDK